MDVSSIFKNWFKESKAERPTPTASFNGQFRQLFTHSYNGEKNLGEIGPIKAYGLNYEALRLRSWQAYLESEIAQLVLKRFTTWMIGSGLKLQAQPVKNILSSEKITIDQDFNDAIEARFNVFSESTSSDYSGMHNLNMLAKTAYMNAIIGGDVLVILRVVENDVKVQLIDGSHVCSPQFGTEYSPQFLQNGNVIKNGIEISPTGEHIAYYVRDYLYQYTRIPAKSESTGLTMCFLIYGLEYRLDNVRGMPLIATVLETIKKMERYKEATVGSAEERQKIPYFFEHDIASTGENPATNRMAKAFNLDGITDELPIDVFGNALADKVAASTNKQVINMPNGATVKSLESKSEIHFEGFYSANINIVCGTVGIPPEVALSKYDSNFSASRAALKDWEHTLNVGRKEFAFAFYQKIYNVFLEIEILKNKITAPGYLKAKMDGNNFVLEAYRKARFAGANVPHIDPLKEVAAVRLKLGGTGANIPLTTVEAGTESLNGGESNENMEQYAEEYKRAIALGIPIEPVVPELPNPNQQ